MSSDKTPKNDRPREPQGEKRQGVSRRSFLRGGAAGALAGGLLPQVAAPAGAKAPAVAEPALLGPGAVEIELTINGEIRRVEVEPRVTLLDALRDHLGLTGAKKVCDRGTCGACTVIEDGKLIYACTRLAVDAAGRSITTVEGLGTPERLPPVQAAFVEHDAQQCGFCTPGFVIAASVLLESHPRPSPEEVDRALGGNLCRCGTYGGMREVVLGEKGGRSDG